MSDSRYGHFNWRNTANHRGEYKPTRKVEDWEGTSEYYYEPKKKAQPKKTEYKRKPEEQKEPRREDVRDRDRERDRGRNDREKRTKEDRNDDRDYDREFLDKQEKKANWVVVNSRNLYQYVSESLRLLEKHYFIVVKGISNYILDAFTVADKVGSKSNRLFRINIPGTKKVTEIWWPKYKDQQKKEFERIQPQISIYLSKSPLDARHIGYQTYGKTNYDYNRNNRKRNVDNRRRQEQKPAGDERDKR